MTFLKDRTLFKQICNQITRVRQREIDVVQDVIRKSAKRHLKHITQGREPLEMCEARPLDFGHWSAHKLETLCQYSLRHGEAVAIGVEIDTVYSALAHGLLIDNLDRV